MFAVRLHGRGGQGVVTAAELLALAAFRQGRHAQAFPSFGSERTGAPVAAFCRIADAPIRTHEPIGTPDAVLLADATLLHLPEVLAGLRPGGYLLVNTGRSVAELGLVGTTTPAPRLVGVPATELALTHVGRPVPNAPLLGAFAALTGVVSVDAVCAALEQRFPAAIAARNVAAARAAFEMIGTAAKEYSRA